MKQAERMDTTAAETLVRFLAHRFEVRVPRLRFNNRRDRARYWQRPRLICLSKTPQVKSIIHEFAHHLDCSHQRHVMHEWHSDSFYRCLKLVIAATGCDYNWAQEYKQILRWHREGR